VATASRCEIAAKASSRQTRRHQDKSGAAPDLNLGARESTAKSARASAGEISNAIGSFERPAKIENANDRNIRQISVARSV
jgi:hypothetical protein